MALWQHRSARSIWLLRQHDPQTPKCSQVTNQTAWLSVVTEVTNINSDPDYYKGHRIDMALGTSLGLGDSTGHPD